ncbi:unnamed protein product [Pleuronectes platessa]|uniref:Uncharacterized protein n=1 Tax=Pleuronectes platessa TaxID=8262 RepID=A0A9N7YFC3_PLEPL|nr:unnamed protein product [Pleuronectes platessa]
MQAGLINLNDACSQQQILQCLIVQQKVSTWCGSITESHFYNSRKNNSATIITKYQENSSFQASRFRAGTALGSATSTATAISRWISICCSPCRLSTCWNKSSRFDKEVPDNTELPCVSLFGWLSGLEQ